MTQPDDNHQLLMNEEKGLYDLFSRGARDWLRHNNKVRDSVMDHLPEIIAGPDVISRPENRTVHVPVKFLEHYRFRLDDAEEREGVGQGKQGQVKPGDILRPEDRLDGSQQGGSGQGGYNFTLEIKIDDIVDWLWEELELPNLKPRSGDTLDNEELVREGWDKRGVRSRLDRRRTMKEAIKRRSIQSNGPPITNDDLRFRQLATRKRPSTNAVVFFVLDASSSMGQEDRRLAKTFFFWVLQGLRRQYSRIDTVFIAHTGKAWEFSEDEFFSVTAEGGTEGSVAFELVSDIINSRYDPARYNSYLFYASDGENFFGDRQPCQNVLSTLCDVLNFCGYTEISQYRKKELDTEMGNIFKNLLEQKFPVSSYSIKSHEDIWPAIKKFFSHQTEQEAA